LTGTLNLTLSPFFFVASPSHTTCVDSAPKYSFEILRSKSKSSKLIPSAGFKEKTIYSKFSISTLSLSMAKFLKTLKISWSLSATILLMTLWLTLPLKGLWDGSAWTRDNPQMETPKSRSVLR